MTTAVVDTTVGQRTIGSVLVATGFAGVGTVVETVVVGVEEGFGTVASAGFLKRDPRAKERRKFGLKKARKAPQWSKR